MFWASRKGTKALRRIIFLVLYELRRLRVLRGEIQRPV